MAARVDRVSSSEEQGSGGGETTEAGSGDQGGWGRGAHQLALYRLVLRSLAGHVALQLRDPRRRVQPTFQVLKEVLV